MAWADVTRIRIRSVDSGGNILNTWKPLVSASVGGQARTYLALCEVTKSVEGEIREVREAFDWGRRDIIRGYYPIIDVYLETVGGIWEGASGYQSLETVLGGRFGTNHLEISLNDGASYTSVTLEDSDERHTDGLNYGLTRMFTFKGVSLITSEAAAINGGL